MDDAGVNRLPQESPNLSDAIDAVLPQTQCTRCGYPSCRRYAQAIVDHQADINQCPPGGDAGVRRLARITGRPHRTLNPAHGIEKPRQRAEIDESRCIGCTVCIKACPVDAIVGGFKAMHTVLVDRCTGCELCIAPCPVDCIVMTECIGSADWTEAHALRARRHFEAHEQRLQRRAQTGPGSSTDDSRLAGVLARAKARAAARIP